MRERSEVGGYKLIKRIGYGGMSVVFEAEDGAGKRVALKLLNSSVINAPGGRERLQREVRMLQKVRGTYVAEVLDYETDSDDAFIVTELIDGPTLEQDVADAGIFTEGDLVDLARQLERAVSSIHLAGVLHRDLKPTNVMMSEHGPVLIDFGIAQLDEDSRLTQAGSLSHTPGYCDPRVIRGTQPDEAADWWSLAAVLAYAATGSSPYGEGNSHAIGYRAITGEANLSGLPPALEGAFSRALSPDLDSRISFEELVAILEDPTRGEYLTFVAGSGSSADGGSSAGSGSVPTEVGVEPILPAEVSGETLVPDASGEVAGLEFGLGSGVPMGETAQVGTQPTEAFSGQAERMIPPTSVLPPGENPANNQYPVAQANQPLPGAVASFIGAGQNSPFPLGEMEGGAVPTWLRPPPRARLATLLCGLALVILASFLPGVSVFVYFGVATLASTIGYSTNSLRRRRLEKGGPRRSDHVSTALRVPLAFIRAAVLQALNTCVGLFFGFAVMWAVSVLVPGSEQGVLLLAASVGFSVAWLIGTNETGKVGARTVAAAVAPSLGYKIFWVAFFVCLLGAMAMFAMGNPLDWMPFSQPFFIENM